MDALAIELGYAAIGLILFLCIMWVVSHSPLLAWLMKIALLLLWGAASVGAVLVVVSMIYIPRGQYFTALLTALGGAILYVPWFAFGVPELKNCFQKNRRRNVLWE